MMENNARCWTWLLKTIRVHNMLVVALCFAGAAGTCIAETGKGTTLRVTQGSHPMDAYAIGLLRLGLAQLDERYIVDVTEEQVTQTRGIEKLKDGRIDVMWLGTTRDLESQLLPIRFPMLKGLLGYRVNIINPENQRRFSQIRNFDDLKKLSFGQGSGWPDVDILRGNDLKVVATSKYENLFRMVEGGRFDGFPRGVSEAWAEVENHPDLELAVEENIVLVYTMPFYFFVAPDNQQLAAAIHRGLDLALENGAFDEYFFSQGMVADALSKARLKERKAFHLTSPILPTATPLDRRDYWLDVDML